LLDVVNTQAVAQGLCVSERLAQEAMWMFFSQVGRKNSILNGELVNGKKNSIELCAKSFFTLY